MMESGELVVRYRARRTYSRRTTEATCECPNMSAWKDDTNTVTTAGRHTIVKRAQTCLSVE